MASNTLDMPGAARSLTATCQAAPPFARVDVFDDAAPVLDAWRDLETSAPCSIYQTRGFVLPWIETLGRMHGLTPMFVLATDREKRPVALLCLGVKRQGAIRIATWLGGKDANFNLALLRRPGIWTKADVQLLLDEAARSAAAPDVFALPNQPYAWAGSANPFAQLSHRPSASAAYATALPHNAEQLFAEKLSKDARKKLRKKEAKLAASGPITHTIARSEAEQSEIIDTFLAQKTERFRARGIVSDFDAPEMRAFLLAASMPRGRGIELHALRVAGRIVATYGGAMHDGQWSGMFNSITTDEEIAKSSPGDILLMRIIDGCCRGGITRFDLGIGEARYKAALCDEAVALFDAYRPVTMKGRVYGTLARLWLGAKRRIKRDPRLLRWANRLRRSVAS